MTVLCSSFVYIYDYRPFTPRHTVITHQSKSELNKTRFCFFFSFLLPFKSYLTALHTIIFLLLIKHIGAFCKVRIYYSTHTIVGEDQIICDNSMRDENEKMQRCIKCIYIDSRQNYDSEGSKKNRWQIVIDFLYNTNQICMMMIKAAL